jgi:hypothetical protein
MKALLFILMIPSIALASVWQCIDENKEKCTSWKWNVPHGWMVLSNLNGSNYFVTYMPDEQHKWKEV